MVLTDDDTPCAEPSPWRAFARRGLLNQLLCLAIAGLSWLLSSHSGGFVVTWIYSTAIGTCCWFFIDGGRIALAQWLHRHRPGRVGDGARLARWPGVAWMLVCIAGGTLAGYSLGSAIADTVTGLSSPSLAANKPALAITLIAAIAATFYFYSTERLIAERAAAEAARRLAAESQLRLLESQLEPHMLFNTLANLRVLIGVDPARAQAMLDRLIAFLRATLGASRSGMQPLAAEFDRLADYLALMAVRMGPRLAVHFDLPAELREQVVPALLLQPLVENSIKHGLEPKIEGGRIEISARREAGQLVLAVHDTGVGLQARAAATDGSRYGTAHVRERLAALYGERASFSLAPAAGGQAGTLASLRLPLAARPESAS